MKNLPLSLVILLFYGSTLSAQNLTISSSGQTGTTGTNWSISGNALTVTGTATIAASVIENHLTSNSLSIQGNSTSFVVNVSQAITSSTSGNGLTIGAASNTGNILLNSAISLAGSVTIIGGRVSIMEAFSLSSTSNLSITSINTVIAGTTTIGGSASISTSGNFILGTNITAGTGFPLTASGGFTKTGAGTSYLFSNINTTNTAVTMAGPVVVGNFNTSNAITQISTNGGNISIPGAVSAYSGIGRDYMALVYANLYDATGGAVTGSTTDIYLRFNAGNQSFVGLPGMPASFNMQYLLVAAGGGGGGSYVTVKTGGGGGGGGVAEGNLTYNAGNTLNMVIGTGGVGGAGDCCINGINGGDSGFNELGLWVGGGGGGGHSAFAAGNTGTGNNNLAVAGRSYLAGGGGGGSGRENFVYPLGGTGTLYPQAGSGTQTSFGNWAPWGGGGGGAVSGGYFFGDLGYGGAGGSSSITGVSVVYGSGSGSRDRTNTIGSGGSSNTYDAVSANGSNGAVILRFALSSTLDAVSVSTAFHLNAIAGSVTLGSTVANLSNIEITAGIVSSITGPITGTGSLLKTGTGALTLSGDNRYTGGTTVTTGTLVLNDTAPMDGLGVVVGTLNINQNGTVQLTGLASALGYNTNRVTTININGGVLEAASGQQHIWNLTGGLNFNGGGTVKSNSGTSAAGATSYFEWGVTNITITNPTSPAEIAGRINLRSDLGGVVFTVADGTAANDLIISAAITESSAPTLTKTGAGKLTFTGVNSYTGATTVSSGTLQIGDGSTSGTISSGAVTNNAALIFNRSDAYTTSNVISGTGTVTKTGAGTLTLSGANTYTGLSTIAQGTLKCGSATALGTVAGSTTIVDGATLDLNGLNYSTAEPLTINGTGVSASGVISNSTTTAATFAGPITLASNATINGKDANITLSGSINGAYALNVNSLNKTYTQSGIVGGTTPPTAYVATVGNTGSATLSGVTTVAGPVSISGGTLAINANLTATANNVTLSAVTAVTQSAPIIATGLDLNGAGTFTLTNTTNNIATLAGGSSSSKLGTVNYIDSNGFTIGTVTNTGITASGTITAETQLGNITIAQNITTDNTTSSAITINAGKPKSIGDAIGGNVVISGAPVITTGTNGITKLFSGREAESTGLTAFVGGTTNVRLGVDETTATFAPVLANNNKYALYRYGDLILGGITIVSSGGVTVNNGWEFVNNTITPTSAVAINIDASVLQNYLVTNPLTVKAGSITFSANIANTTANQLTLNSNTFIKNTNVTTITTVGGNVLMAANIDDATDNDTTTNGYIQFSSGLTMTTNGGNITLGGGDATASSYALGTSAYPYEGIRVDGTLNLNSGGGTIVMRGKSYAANTTWASWGLGFWNLTGGTINSGTGTVLLDGFSQSLGGTYNSGLFNQGDLTITSANTTADAIQLIGKAIGASNDAWGIEAESALSVLATGDGGGITISTSQLSSNTYDAVFRGVTNILAKSGPIKLLGKQNGGIANGKWHTGSDFYLGSKASTTVPTSSSNITIQYDRFEFSGSRNISTIGTVTFEPASTSFGQEVLTSWFNWNQNGQTMSGLTIGKIGNTANVTHQTTAVTVAGPINFYGGDITLSQNISSTLSGADVLLQGIGAINLASSKTIQTSAGDVTLSATSGGTATSSSSAIYLNSSSQILSNGGSITLGGGYSGTEGNLYAATTISGGGYAVRMDANSIINAAGGNINIYGRNVSSYGDGVYFSSVNISTLGTGTIGIYGDSYGGFNGTTYYGGISFENNASTIQNVNGSITLKGILTQSQHAEGYAINFYRSAGVTGQTKHIQIVSQTGAIQITGDRGTSIGRGFGHSSWGNIYFGSPSDNSFTATGAIKFTYSSLVIATNNGFKVKTTGPVTYEPAAASFITAQTLPANAFSTLADGASSLTIGKSGNTADITMGTAQTVAGPISIYAGTITLNSDLTTTNNGAISLYSDNAIAGLSAQRNITAAGFLNYIPQSNSFAAAVTYPITNLNVSSTGLLIGKPTNTANVTFGNTTSINGPITAYGGAIALNANLTTTNATTGNIALNGTTIAGTGNITLATGKTATFNITTASTYDGVISGTNSGFTKTGTGLLTLTKDHTYSGPTVVATGNLQVGTGGSVSQASSGTVSNTSGVTVASNSKFILTPNENIIFTAPIAGAGGVEIKGASGAYYNSFLTGTAATIASNSTVLEVLKRITGGLQDGLNITGTQTAGAYIKSYNAATNTATLQFQQFEGTFTKCVFVQLTQSGTSVQIRGNTSIYNGAAYRTGNFVGTDMSTGSTQIGPGLATTSSGTGYGISQVYMSGKVNFTGNLTYTGNTTLSNIVTSVTSPNTYSYTSKGTQEITDASSSFPSASTVINNGLVIFNRATPLNISSDMTGIEEVLQVGAPITFTGTNTYSGNTTIDLNKSLVIGSGGTTGSMAGDIVNYGSLGFNRSDASTYSGIISQSGSVSKSGDGDLTFTGLNSYVGATTITAGRLILERDIPTTSSSSYSGAGTLVIQPSSNSFPSAVSYPIAGFTVSSSIGGLTIGKPTNSANITFANATTVTGPITAYGGTITLDANLSTSNNGAISLYTDNPLGGLNTARTLNAAGAFKYIPRTTAFTADVTYPIANLTSTSAGLTIGNVTNDKNITITQDVTGPFGIELYGNNVTINSNLTTTGINAIMYLKGNTTIAAGKYITSGGNFTHDGNMTFKSTATGTAAFGTLGGTFTTVSGATTVERYFPAKRVFRFVSSAVTTTSNIRTNWQENGGTVAGLGTHITGTGGATNGFDPTASNNPSMYTFNNTSSAWVAVANTISNTLTAGIPYRLNIRGDRTINLSTNTPTPTTTTLRATGTLATGTINAGTLSTAAYAYNFIGNPYQAPVNMKMALDNATNLNNVVYYVWDPTVGTRGAYISVDLTTNTVIGTSAANKYLQPGQACFVRTAAVDGATNLNFQEIYKAVDAPNQLVFKNTAQDPTAISNIRLNLYDSNSLALNLTALDGILVFFDDAYSNDVDQNDGGKFANPDEMLSTYNSGTLVSIEKRMQPTTNDTIPLRISQYRGTDYTLVAQGTNLNGVPAYLHDQFLQTYTEIPQSGSINYPFSIVTANTQTTATDRFRIVYNNPLLSNSNNQWMQFTLYPNPSKQGNFNINFPQIVNSGKVTIYNTLGEKVHTQDVNATIQTTINPNKPLATGIYYVEIEMEANKSVKKLIIE